MMLLLTPKITRGLIAIPFVFPSFALHSAWPEEEDPSPSLWCSLTLGLPAPQKNRAGNNLLFFVCFWPEVDQFNLGGTNLEEPSHVNRYS